MVNYLNVNYLILCMRKGLFVFLVVLALVPFVAADVGCCLESVNGAYCVDQSTENNCLGDVYDGMTCAENFDQCEVGCCVFEDTGMCSEGSVEASCSGEGGTFYDAFSDEYSCYGDAGGWDECTPGCCIVGGVPYYMTEIECNANFETDDYTPYYFSGTEETC